MSPIGNHNSDGKAASSAWRQVAFPDACCTESCFDAENIKVDKNAIQTNN